ncbi:hypothetical protein GCM10007876_07750 [Litoribrevibacter albus]|uniref:Uncharacterized protein n=1 Tax=Litoribrevibacter albus TaxID=1473156 RepID=A0AA37W4M1_9GAMM|nr:hypothetical protein GCM10007876_07750 [Litoribrevibacter albus]
MEERLKEWEEMENAFSFLCWFTLLFIKASRLLLKQFYKLNLFICRSMSRHMEYDADKYECFISGSAYFEQTALALWKTDYGHFLAHEINQNTWNSNKLINNLPETIAEETKKLSNDALSDIQKRMSELTTNWWDSHPADNDRIEHAKSHEFAPIWTDEGPAKELFGNFEQLCHATTSNEYRLRGFNDQNTTYIDYEQAVGEQQLEDEELSALEEFQFGLASYRCLYLPDKFPAPTNISSTIEALKKHQELWEQADTDYWDGRSTTTTAILAKIYLEADLPLPYDEQKTFKTIADCDHVISNASQQWYNAKQKLKQVDVCLAQRIANIIPIMTTEEKSHLKSQVKFFKFLERTEDYWLDLRRYTWILEQMLEEDDIYEDDLAPFIQRYKTFIKEPLENIVSLAPRIEIVINNHQTQSLLWWYKEWVEDFDPKADYSASHLHYLAKNTGRLLFYLTSRISASMAYNCLQAEKRATKSDNAVHEITEHTL